MTEGRVPMNPTTMDDIREVGNKRTHNMPEKKEPKGYKGKPEKAAHNVPESKVDSHGSGWF